MKGAVQVAGAHLRFGLHTWPWLPIEEPDEGRIGEADGETDLASDAARPVFMIDLVLWEGSPFTRGQYPKGNLKLTGSA